MDPINPLTVLFCLVPLIVVALVIGLPLLSFFVVITGNLAEAEEKRAKANERLQKERRQAELHEARIAEAHNKVVLQESRLELQELKIKEIKHDHKVRGFDTRFEAKDYDSDR